MSFLTRTMTDFLLAGRLVPGGGFHHQRGDLGAATPLSGALSRSFGLDVGDTHKIVGNQAQVEQRSNGFLA